MLYIDGVPKVCTHCVEHRSYQKKLRCCPVGAPPPQEDRPPHFQGVLNVIPDEEWPRAAERGLWRGPGGAPPNKAGLVLRYVFLAANRTRTFQTGTSVCLLGSDR